MKVFISSDLHLGNRAEGDVAIKKLARYANKTSENDDVLSILGDIGNDNNAVEECLSHFEEFKGKKLLVFGNHDLWISPNSCSSLERLEQLNLIAQRNGFQNMENEPFTQGDYAFVGSCGWYDYSFADLQGIPPENYMTKIFPGDDQPGWNDAIYVKWPYTDAQAVEMMLAKLSDQIRRCQGKKIVVGMHHLPVKKLLFHPRALVPARWRFYNAFLGSQKFHDELFRKHAQEIEHVFCGHVHLHKSIEADGVKYTSVGSTYEKKQLIVLEDNRLKKILFD